MNSGIKKDSLDIQYKHLSQKATVYLTVMTITLIGFVGYMLSQGNPDFALGFGTVIFIISLILHKKTENAVACYE